MNFELFLIRIAFKGAADVAFEVKSQPFSELFRAFLHTVFQPLNSQSRGTGDVERHHEFLEGLIYVQVPADEVKKPAESLTEIIDKKGPDLLVFDRAQGAEHCGAVFLHKVKDLQDGILPCVGILTGLIQQRPGFLIEHPLEKVDDRFKMIVKRLPVESAAFGEFADGDLVEWLFRHQFFQRCSE